MRACRHVDMQTEGTDACQRALDTVIKLPEAKELFDESLNRFRDVTCIGLCNWANVHLCHAKKLLEHAAEGGKRPSDIKKDFEEHCKEALKRYNEALGYNSALSAPIHVRVFVLGGSPEDTTPSFVGAALWRGVAALSPPSAAVTRHLWLFVFCAAREVPPPRALLSRRPVLVADHEWLWRPRSEALADVMISMSCM